LTSDLRTLSRARRLRDVKIPPPVWTDSAFAQGADRIEPKT
jgi:hypothetical protein